LTSNNCCLKTQLDRFLLLKSNLYLAATQSRSQQQYVQFSHLVMKLEKILQSATIKNNYAVIHVMMRDDIKEVVSHYDLFNTVNMEAL